MALLGLVYLLEQSAAGNSDREALDRDIALERYGFYLEEVTEQAGVQFRHKAPRLDEQLAHIMPQVASVGASVSVTDFNNDGWQDLYLTNSRRGTANALLKNNGDGTFTDVAPDLGVAALNSREAGASMGSVWGDYDNDGYEDLFVYRWGRPALYHNDGGAGFTEVTGQSAFPEWVNANATVWLDYDRDGYLDLFMAGYFDESIDLWNLETTRIMPESFEYANNGGRKYLFRNQGDGTFEEVSRELGIESNRWTLSVAAADLTGNGYPDLIMANDYGVDEFFINREGRTFERGGEAAGMGFAPKSGMNVSYGDILNQGKLAVYITNISEPGVLIQGNNLWVPGSADGPTPAYTNMAGNLGVELAGWSYGAQFGDLNNDGHLDLYVANGYVSAEEGADYWYDFSKVAGGNRTIIGDAKNWPDMKGRSLSGYQQNRVWLNDGAGKFREVGAAIGGALELDSRAIAYADLWNRGVLDVVVASQNGPVTIFRNQVQTGRHWIGFSLKGTRSNASAIGAEIELTWAGKRQVQVLSGGSGFSAQNQRRLYFGLGEAQAVDKAVIRWPSGMRQTLANPDVDQLHTLTEPDSLQGP